MRVMHRGYRQWQPMDDGTRLRETQLATEIEKRDRLLARAQENRELAAAQMDENWLGVKLLAHLRESPYSQVTELAVMVGEAVDSVATTLVRLARFGVVSEKRQQFVCTEKGLNLLGKLEASTGISLTP